MTKILDKGHATHHRLVPLSLCNKNHRKNSASYLSPAIRTITPPYFIQ